MSEDWVKAVSWDCFLTDRRKIIQGEGLNPDP